MSPHNGERGQRLDDRAHAPDSCNADAIDFAC
jgi:hypothetical protein